MSGLVVSRGPVTNGLLAHLRTQTGRPVGDGDVPAITDVAAPLAPGSALTPYAIVYSIPEGNVWGSLSSPQGSAGLVYQVTCVGDTRDGAEWMSDLVRQHLSCVTFAIAAPAAGEPFDTVYVMSSYTEGSPAGATREGTIWNAQERYDVEVSTSG